MNGQFPSDAPAVMPIDEPGRTMMFRGVMIMVALEPLVIVIILALVGVPWWMIGGILGAGVILMAAVFALISLTVWKPWQRRYPAQQIREGAVSQSWQTFAFGRLSRLNNCVTIIADEKHLHLVAFAPLRWVGAGTISLPLDRMTEVRRGWPGLMVARLDGRTIAGPEWCMRLAAAGERDAPFLNASSAKPASNTGKSP